ncbi:MAG: BatA domain-containing protein [Verrucomicrobiales bacterium]|nr:BatA domain-containing protein [Verrucomicrobiales bacterium]
MLTFGNPIGFLALLGIPVVIAIHFLQRKSQVLTVTTLFLLDQMQRESVSGSRFERLRSSVPLWLQLLIVCLITWLLSEPRWLRKDSVQRVAVVLDNSASMAVYKDDTLELLKERLAELATASTISDYVLLESTISDQRLYTGTSLADFTTAASSDWHPRFGNHDPTPVLRVARSIVGATGLVIYATDYDPPEPLPFSTKVASIAEPVANVGFAGLSISNVDGQPVWSALIRNYGDSPVTRSWWIEAANQKTEPRTISLEPGTTTTIQGPFLESLAAATVRMANDDFPIDDALPIVRPQPKPLTLWKNPSIATNRAYTKLFKTFNNLGDASAPETADVTATSYLPTNPELPATNGFLFVKTPSNAKYSTKPIVVENHPLTVDLNWQGLLARQHSLKIPARDVDETLVWQGEYPLVFLRATPSGRLLCFNFDLDKSNAAKLPAFVVVIHRFLESLRINKIAEEAANFETGQDLNFAFDVSAGAPQLSLRSRDRSGQTVSETFPLMQATAIDAPPLPGFFEIYQGENRLLKGAAHFADTREADFTGAASRDDLVGISSSLVDEHTERDSLWRLWLLLSLAALLTSWHFTKTHAAPPAPIPSPSTH